MKCFGRFWEALAASVRVCKALVQWMLWKVLEALGVFERYGRLLEDFRKLSKALGSFDVSMVCPLPGLWINHVAYFAHMCVCDSVLMRCSLWQAVPESS